MKKQFDSIESVVADLRQGRLVIVVDDADRENEGDLIMAAERVTAETVNFMVMASSSELSAFGRLSVNVATPASVGCAATMIGASELMQKPQKRSERW